VFPAATWETVPAAESAGYRSAALDSLRAYLRTLNTTGMVVAVHGRVLFSYGNVTEQSYLASARKSVLSMLYGPWVANGTIRLDETLAQLGIDDLQGLTPAERRATVRNLLMTSSGVYHPASNAGDNLGDAPPRGSQEPGAYFLYSNWDFNALGTIFEQKAGRNIYDALQDQLARPIEMEDWDRARQRKSGDTRRSRHQAYHMDLTTRDMARLGYLMLRQGRWRDTVLVPEAWVKESTSPLVPSQRMNPVSARGLRLGYGYLWWIHEEPGTVLEGGYSARGAVGQYITVLPKLDMVIAHKRALRPGQPNPAVTWPQYVEVLQRLAGARCGRVC
jgi:CubicO group peptidase (beta-lactamase class C family)